MEYSYENIPQIFFDESTAKTDLLIAQFRDQMERWELPTLRCVASFSVQGEVVYSSDGRYIAHPKKDANAVVVRDAFSGAQLLEFQHPPATGTFSPSVECRFTPDSRELWLVDDGRTFAFRWSIPSGANLPLQTPPPSKHAATHPLGLDSRRVDGITFSSNGARADAWSFHHAPGDLTSWDRRTGAILYDGKFLAMTHRDQPVRVIDDERQLWIPPAATPRAQFKDYSEFQFLADPERVLALDDGVVTLLARFRPEEWWGLAWLPEFWVTVVLAGLNGWLVLKSFRSQKSEVKS